MLMLSNHSAQLNNMIHLIKKTTMKSLDKKETKVKESDYCLIIVSDYISDYCLISR